VKAPQICVGTVLVSKLRFSFRTHLDEKIPLIVRRNSRAVGILLSVESSFLGDIVHPRKQRARLRAELEAVLAKLR
jgi:hypothetical protein